MMQWRELMGIPRIREKILRSSRYIYWINYIVFDISHTNTRNSYESHASFVYISIHPLRLEKSKFSNWKLWWIPANSIEYLLWFSELDICQALGDSFSIKTWIQCHIWVTQMFFAQNEQPDKKKSFKHILSYGNLCEYAKINMKTVFV